MFENKYNLETETREATFHPEDESEVKKQKKRKKRKRTLKTIGILLCIGIISTGSITAYKYVDNYIDENGVPFSSLFDKEKGKESESESEVDKENSSKNQKENSSEKETAEKVVVPTKSLIEMSKKDGALSVQEIYQKVLPSVVGITSAFEVQYNAGGGWFFGDFGETQTQEVQGTGTGIIISKDGYVLTNAHVVYSAESGYGEAKYIKVLLSDKKEYDAKVIGIDSATDIAVIKIEASDLVAADFGDSADLQVGDPAVAIGNPLGFDLFGTLTVGYISGLNREISANDVKMGLIQTDAAINSGNSGGPLINMFGQVVGINSLKMTSTMSGLSSINTVEGLGFAIPITEAKVIIDELISNGAVSRPQLGISVMNSSLPSSSQDSSTTGVVVAEVFENGPAYKSGMQVGDIIVGANGELVTNIDELNSIKNKLKIGDKIKITLIRNRQYMDVEVVLEAPSIKEQTNEQEQQETQKPKEEQ